MNGLYLHIPFCVRKCPYCDFYSLGGAAEARRDDYTRALIDSMRPYAGAAFDTVYFGGGTPPLLGADNLCRVLEAAARLFSLSDPEVTLECNPGSTRLTDLPVLRAAGFNRLSVGLQSSDPDELRFLGRPHTAEDAARLVLAAADAGFANVSLDLMAALPGQSAETLRRSVSFCAGLPITHLSGYLLKVEPGTSFFERGVEPPDGDAAADLYLTLCEACKRAGFAQYEISNFARPGYESRHNCKYWRLEPYLGLGPAAHSFWNGRRFYWQRDLDAFCRGTASPVDDGAGGGGEEYLMLGLRLTEGVSFERLEALGGASRAETSRILRPYQNAGLVAPTPEGFRLTREGFLVSNAILCELTDLLFV